MQASRLMTSAAPTGPFAAPPAETPPVSVAQAAKHHPTRACAHADAGRHVMTMPASGPRAMCVEWAKTAPVTWRIAGSQARQDCETRETGAILCPERPGGASISHISVEASVGRSDMTDEPKNAVGPETPNPELTFHPGIPGATCISIQRRVQDSRFATRYFVGNGIDVGGGRDSLALFGEMFPLMRHVVLYDQEHGDAQFLSNVADDAFDFLYSSHCLEHVRDPAEALGNWIRVVRPGGHLVISVPDEDLYEQGQWPSTFNPDHKTTFTLCKQTSWSPVSINLFQLLEKFAGSVQPLSVSTIDHAYRYRTSRHDQTRTPLTEAAIEIILRKT